MHRHEGPNGADRDATHPANPYDQLLRAGLCRDCGKPTVAPNWCRNPYCVLPAGHEGRCQR